MKLIVQRVIGSTSISYDDQQQSFEGPGLVVYWGWEQRDENEDLEKNEDRMLAKAIGLRIFPDQQDKMNLNLEDYLNRRPIQNATQKAGGMLWVPQFTLAADMGSGFRPSFKQALHPQVASMRFSRIRGLLSAQNKPYSNLFGRFGADMRVSYTNCGPVTIPLSL